VNRGEPKVKSVIAVCTLGCTRKIGDIHSWETLTKLEGEYQLYINFEHSGTGPIQETEDLIRLRQTVASLITQNSHLKISFDEWSWKTEQGYLWRKLPQFDQDQARLASIVCARNMCIEYAMQTGASHLLFIDADIVPPSDIIPKLLQVNHSAVGGLVHGRGAHSSSRYVFGQKSCGMEGDPPYEIIVAEHSNIGFTMIERKLFEAIRLRWGTSYYPDGRINMTSDDPAFHLDCFLRFGHWMKIRTDVIGQHVGDLRNEHGAQF
jgi:hypothetical protein